VTLAPGSRLGPYEITAKLGEGGMGEVYRATDTKLKRDVAIKVLPAAFTEDQERLARFEREAQLLAQLHHPNIASIFGLEESNGTRALVMELVEGPTLAARLESGPLPFNEALSVSLQIALALEEAHEKGIVHRDLKPQNIKAPIEGNVKVLDFGLAKAMDPAAGAAASASELARSPTLTAAHGTQLGVILGTAAYMAPEQAKGLPIDKRADIWAFGVVLFETLTGRSLFAGDSVPETLAHVLTREPDFDSLPASTPAAIRRLLRRCLERNPKRRLRDVGDARIVLEEVAAGAGAEPAAAGEPVERSRLPWAIAALAVVVALGALAIAFRGAAGAAPSTRGAPTRTSLLMPSRIDSEQQPGTFALSPDGGAVVFRASDDSGAPRLFVREIAELEPRPLEGSEGATFPFWSADSNHVAFFAGGDLRRVARTGGVAQRVAAATGGRGGAWSRDGTIVYAPEPSGPLWKVRASGGEPAPATLAEGGGTEESHRFPLFLPDGRHFLFLGDDSTHSERIAVRVASLDEVTAGRELLAASSTPRFAPPDELVFQREAALLVQRIDLDRLEMIGEPRLLADRPELRVLLRGAPVVDLSEGGRMLYAAPDPRPSALAWLDRRGAVLGGETRAEAALLQAAISRRGDRIAANGRSLDTNTALWTFGPGGGRGARVTAPRDFPWGLAWSADDRALVTWIGEGKAGTGGSLSLVATANGEIRRLLPPSNRWMQPTDVSADGRTLLYWELRAGSGRDLGYLSLDGEPNDTVYLSTSANESGGRLSPDGRWIAYLSDASGKMEAIVDTFPRPTAAHRVVTDGAVNGVNFRADGRELLLVAADGDSAAVFACDLRLGERAEIGAPRKLFALPRDWTDLEPTPAGDRFLLVRPAGERWPSLTLVDDWRAQLAPER
jgi:Tol biopolymer transport system component